MVVIKTNLFCIQVKLHLGRYSRLNCALALPEVGGTYNGGRHRRRNHGCSGMQLHPQYSASGCRQFCTHCNVFCILQCIQCILHCKCTHNILEQNIPFIIHNKHRRSSMTKRFRSILRNLLVIELLLCLSVLLLFIIFCLTRVYSGQYCNSSNRKTRKKHQIQLLSQLHQGRRNVTQSEGASETSISSRVKTNLSTMDFYADLCFPRPGELFSV